jgi:phosphate transporter
MTLYLSSDSLLETAIEGLDVWPILAIFSVMSLIVATFVSHSIAAVLIAPIAARIGDALDPPHPRLLIMATALICSSGMALPVSGFPNLMAVNLEDDLGQRYLNVEDFLKTGVSHLTRLLLSIKFIDDMLTQAYRFPPLC